MTLFAKIYSGGIQIQRCVIFRLECTREVTCAAAVTAAYFQNIFPAQINLCGDMMIKLDASAIRFVCWRKYNAHRRLFFVSVIEK